MIANAIHTKWKFIVEFEDEETGAIEGTLGKAADRDECELLVEDEMEYQRLRGYIRVTAEAVELCEQCEGEQHPRRRRHRVDLRRLRRPHRNTFHLQARPRRRDDVHAMVLVQIVLSVCFCLARRLCRF